MSVAIAVLSQKGGTGKTTMVRSLADVFERLGVDVLAVDADPQGNLSDYFDTDAAAHPTLGEVLQGQARAADAVHGRVIPANLRLAEAELMLAGKIGREVTLRNALRDLRRNRELILIDCPPTLGLMTVNALVAATHAILSTEAQYFSLQGMAQRGWAEQPTPDLDVVDPLVRRAAVERVGARVHLEDLDRVDRLLEPRTPLVVDDPGPVDAHPQVTVAAAEQPRHIEPKPLPDRNGRAFLQDRPVFRVARQQAPPGNLPPNRTLPLAQEADRHPVVVGVTRGAPQLHQEAPGPPAGRHQLLEVGLQLDPVGGGAAAPGIYEPELVAHPLMGIKLAVLEHLLEEGLGRRAVWAWHRVDRGLRVAVDGLRLRNDRKERVRRMPGEVRLPVVPSVGADD